MHVPSSRRARTPARPAPWYARDGGARLETDRALVAASAYSDLSFRIDRDERLCLLDGELVYRSESGIRTRIPVRIEFPADYPRGEPRAYDVSNRFIHDPDGHFMSDGRSDGRCCLWLDWESGWSPQDPEGLLRFLDQVAIFFHRQLIFEAGGRKHWPGPARGHGFDGYHEFLRDGLSLDGDALRSLLPALERYGSFRRSGPCPCGSGRQYPECHLDRVTEIVQRVGRWKVERRIAQWRRCGYPGLPSGRGDTDSASGTDGKPAGNL